MNRLLTQVTQCGAFVALALAACSKAEAPAGDTTSADEPRAPEQVVTWVRDLPLDADIAAVVELEDGYALAGTAAHPERGDKDMLLLRLDNVGNELWRRTYGGTDKEYAYGLATTADGGFILCGQTSSFKDYGGDAFVVRTNDKGEEQWANSYGAVGTDAAVAVLPAKDAGFHILGRTYQGGSGLEIYAFSIDLNGTMLNERTFGGADDQYLSAASALPDDAVLLAGVQGRLNFAELQPLLMKFNPANGEVLWRSETRTDGAVNPETVSVVATASGRPIFVAGVFETEQTEVGARPIEREPEGQSITLIAEDTSADVSDSRSRLVSRVGDSVWSEPRAVMAAKDGLAVVAGTTRAYGAGGKDILLFKFGKQGDQVWSGTMGGEGDEALHTAIATGDGGFLLIGEKQDEPSRQLWLIKTDERGQAIVDGQPLRSANLLKAVGSRDDAPGQVLKTPAFLQEDAPKVGEEAPEINVGTWFNADKPLTLADLRGKVVVVELWATWCGPCRHSTPHLVELSEKYADKGVVFLGLTDEDPAAAPVEAFIDEFNIPYPVGAKSTAVTDYGVTGIPTAFVVDKAGVIQWVGHPMDDLAARIDAVLAD